jgi:hypothetical protein
MDYHIPKCGIFATLDAPMSSGPGQPSSRVSTISNLPYPCAWCTQRWPNPAFFGRPGLPCSQCAANWPWLLD